MTRAIRRRRDVWGRRILPATATDAAGGSAWFDRRGHPRTARRSGRVMLAGALVIAALVGFATFALAADISNHSVLSNGRLEHHGTLDDAVWIPPADASWDLAPPSPTLDDARPDHRPALVDPPPRPGAPAPRGPTTPTTPSTTTPSPVTPTPATPTLSAPASTTAAPPSTPSATDATIPPDATTPPDAVVTPETAAAIAAIDDARGDVGCAPLRADTRLVDAATDHAEELAAGTGDTAAAPRMLAAGYASPGGENVARGQASLADATDELLASASHRANVVDCSFTAVGLAHAAGPQGDFWVQDFGR